MSAEVRMALLAGREMYRLFRQNDNWGTTEGPEWDELSEAEQHRWHDTARDHEVAVLVQEGILHRVRDELDTKPEAARVWN